MNIFSKSIYTVAAFGLGLSALSSCSDDKTVEYVPAEPVSGEEVYFNANPQTQYNLTEDGTSFTVLIYRADDASSITVPVTVTPQDGNTANSAFTFPSSVTFNAGQSVANFVVDYDITQLEYDDEQQFLLTIDENYSTPYGSKTLMMTAVWPAPWTYLGIGTYADEYWWITDESVIGSFGFYQNDLDKNLFRIENPYYYWNGEDTYFEFRLLQVGDTYLSQEVTIPNLVGYADYFAEYNASYDDDVYIVFPGRFTSLGDPSNWVYNYVVDYQENGLPGEIHLSPYYYMFNTGGWNQTTTEPITIIFPGYEALDTEILVEYVGMLNEAAGTEKAVAEVQLGADITSARAAVVSGKDVDSAQEAIENDEIDYVTISASGQVSVPFTGTTAGTYSIVVVGYVDGEARSVGAVQFNYTPSNYDPNQGWTSLGYVEYTDGYMCASYLVYPETYYVEIQENDETSGLYRLVDPYGAAYPYNEPGDWNEGVTSYLYVNASNPNAVYITESEQTIDWGDGPLVCYSMAANYIENGGYSPEQVAAAGYCGTLTDGVITFPAKSLLTAFGSDGWYYANEAIDVDLYLEEGVVDYIYDEDGELYAPFCIDLNTMTAANSTKALSRSAKQIASSKAKTNFWNAPKLPKTSKTTEVKKTSSKKTDVPTPAQVIGGSTPKRK